MDTPKDVQSALNMCHDNASKLRALAQTESSQTCKNMLLDAAHYLDVAVAECSYATQNI